MLALALTVCLAAAAPAKGATRKTDKKTETTAPAPAPVTPEIAPAPAQAPVAAAPVLAPPPPPADGKTPRVGVVDFSSAPELQLLAAALGGYVANELQRLGAFQVTTTDQIRQMLSLERQAQLLGCPDDSCRGQLVVSLGFDYVVTGKITRLAGAK